MMRSSCSTIAAALAVILLSAGVLRAQCPNITGNPPPQTEQYAANLVKLRYLGTGPGFNDDRPMLKKSLVQTGFVFNPVTTHNVHVTFRLNSATGPTLWSASIPAGPLWTQVGNKWFFNDPATTYGVRRAKIIDLGGGGYVIVYFRGRNTNVTNAPILPGTDNVYAIIEFEQSGSGLCYGGITMQCTGSGNTQTCHV